MALVQAKKQEQQQDWAYVSNQKIALIIAAPLIPVWLFGLLGGGQPTLCDSDRLNESRSFGGY
jgi:hypothetical protein